MLKTRTTISKFLADEEGLTTVEYAIAGGVVAAGVVGVFTQIGGQVVVKLGQLFTALGGT